MGQIIETKLNRFDGGIVNDPRDPAGNTARVISNFDVLTSPRKMTPYRSSEDGDSASSTSQKQNFCIALRIGSTYSLYSLGVVSGQSLAEILYKNLTTGAANDLDDNSWTNTTNNASASGATAFNLFVYYKRTGLIYGAKGGTLIWTYDPTGAAFVENARAISYTNIAQGLVHSKDDILYFPYDNIVGVNNNGSWTDAGLTLSKNHVITSICEYGNYLAIGVAPISGIGNSRVFLWDRDTTTATPSENIDWGSGSLMILEEIDGVLVGISQKGGTGSSITGNPHGTSSFNDSVIFRYLNGNKAEKFIELKANHAGGANTTQLPIFKQKKDNRLYFQMLIELNGAVRDGVWSIGRSSPSSPLTLIHERTTNNNTILLTSDAIKNFFIVGDYIFQSYQTAGTFTLSKTDDGATFSHNSIYESKIFSGDPSEYKDLIEATVTTEYMPTAGQITLKYRTDQNTSWTTILTNTTDNSISRTVNNSLPKNYKEIQFQILSTGGAEVTGLSFKEEITGRKYNTA